MPNADRCHLNIPHKEYLKGLEKAFDGVEGVDTRALRTMGEHEFDNYKAIERRINDPACQGSCDCVWAEVRGEAGVQLVLTAGTAVSDTIGWGSIADSTPGWSISGGVLIPPSSEPATALYSMSFDFEFQNVSGADDVLAESSIATGSALGTWSSRHFMPSPFDVAWTQSQMGMIGDAGTQELFISVGLTSPTNATRTVNVGMEGIFWQMCSCEVEA